MANLSVAGAVSSTSNATIACMLSHDGDARRTTVVQLYLVFPKAAGEPPQLLRGFSKVSADAGGNVQAEFTLSARELSIWSSDAGAWKLVPGAFGALRLLVPGHRRARHTALSRCGSES